VGLSIYGFGSRPTFAHDPSGQLAPELAGGGPGWGPGAGGGAPGGREDPAPAGGPALPFEVKAGQGETGRCGWSAEPVPAKRIRRRGSAGALRST